MTRDDIIRMAQEAGLVSGDPGTGVVIVTRLMRFAALVAAEEREACAKVCDNAEERAQAEYGGYPEKQAYLNGREFAAAACAAAIRARGET